MIVALVLVLGMAGALVGGFGWGVDHERRRAEAARDRRLGVVADRRRMFYDQDERP